MPAISPPFTVYTLPSLSAASFYVSSPKPSTLDLVVSGAGISRLALRPTPRLASSIAISPLDEVQCSAVVNRDVNGAIFAFCVIRERKRSIFLKRLQEDGAVLQKQISGDALALYPLSENTVMVVVKSGQLTAFEVITGEDGLLQFRALWSVNPYESSKSEIVYSKFVQENDIDTLILVSRSQSSVMDVRKFTISTSKPSETEKWHIQTPESSNEQIQYHESGVILQLVDSLLNIMTLPSLTRSTLDLKKFMNPPKKSSKMASSPQITFLPTGRYTVLVSIHRTLLLINWQYSTILSSLELSECESFRLLQRVGKRSAVGLTEHGELQLVGFDVGSGKLLECVTGKVKRISATTDKAVLANILFREASSARTYQNRVQEGLLSAKVRLQEITRQLSLIKELGDTEAFNSRFIPYLTGKSDWIDYTPPSKASKKEDKRDLSQNDKEHILKDARYNNTPLRNVDAAFISFVIDLFFETTVKDGETVVKLSSFAPVNSLTYLLKHSLFPTSRLPDLLTALASNIHLQMTAIKYTHSLSANALTSELVSLLTQKDPLEQTQIEIVRLLICRLEKDFSYHTIVEALSQRNSIAPLQLSIEKLLSIISSHTSESGNYDIWNILPCFVDASGIFSLENKVISEMSNLVDMEVQDLNGRLEVLEIVDTALEWMQKREVRTHNKFIVR